MAMSKYTNQHLEQDMNQLKNDMRVVKHLLEQGSAGQSDRVLQYVQSTPDPSTSRSMMSDTASTLSSGSEDEEARKHVIMAKCMSGAIQCHFKGILRRVPIAGRLVDEVLERGIVTVDENQRIREFEACVDRMRYLVRNVMSKDYHTMIKFIDLVKEYDPALRNEIVETFSIRRQDDLSKLYSETCTVCLIKKRVDIKLVCDHFFSRELVTDALHRDITESSLSAGNDTLWRQLFEELSKEHPEHVRNVMKDLLTDGEGEQVQHHADIIEIIDRDIKRRRRSFLCRCVSNRKGRLPPMLGDGLVQDNILHAFPIKVTERRNPGFKQFEYKRDRNDKVKERVKLLSVPMKARARQGPGFRLLENERDLINGFIERARPLSVPMKARARQGPGFRLLENERDLINGFIERARPLSVPMKARARQGPGFRLLENERDLYDGFIERARPLSVPMKARAIQGPDFRWLENENILLNKIWLN